MFFDLSLKCSATLFYKNVSYFWAEAECSLILASNVQPLFFIRVSHIFGLRLNVLKYFEDFSLKCS